MITLNELSIGIITFRICRPSIFGDRRYWLELSRELRDFPEMIPRGKMFFDLSLVDI